MSSALNQSIAPVKTRARLALGVAVTIRARPNYRQRN